MDSLSPAQRATLRAAVDRIIPPDDFPGGWDAGVGDYLAGQFARDLAPLVATYCTGLDGLDAFSRTQAGVPFVTLTAALQDDILRQVEAGNGGDSLRAFFDRLVEHAMEGYYGDPGNGGNRGGVAWRMIGFAVRG